MGGERLSKAFIFLHDGLLEFHGIGKGIFAQEGAAGVYVAAVLVFVTPTSGDVEVLQRKPERIQARMAASAVGVFAVLGKFLADGEVLGAGILVERRHIVGRRWRRIIEDYLYDPCAAGDWVGAVGAVVHAEHGGTGDDAAVAGVFHGPAGKGFTTQFVAHLIIELLPRGLLHFADILFRRELLQNLTRLLERGVHGGVLFFLVGIHGLQGVGLGDEQIIAGRRGGDFLGGEGAVVKARFVDGNI